ncbi:hypothetical protein C8R46DRAFT_1348084 [Mycena filopes]|nr:hypothetical protein C8R46DRAFT_1348084 [Mycena filopes]
MSPPAPSTIELLCREQPADFTFENLKNFIQSDNALNRMYDASEILKEALEIYVSVDPLGPPAVVTDAMSAKFHRIIRTLEDIVKWVGPSRDEDSEREDCSWATNEHTDQGPPSGTLKDAEADSWSDAANRYTTSIEEANLDSLPDSLAAHVSLDLESLPVDAAEDANDCGSLTHTVRWVAYSAENKLVSGEFNVNPPDVVRLYMRDFCQLDPHDFTTTSALPQGRLGGFRLSKRCVGMCRLSSLRSWRGRLWFSVSHFPSGIAHKHTLTSTSPHSVCHYLPDMSSPPPANQLGLEGASSSASTPLLPPSIVWSDYRNKSTAKTLPSAVKKHMDDIFTALRDEYYPMMAKWENSKGDIKRTRKDYVANVIYPLMDARFNISGPGGFVVADFIQAITKAMGNFVREATRNNGVLPSAGPTADPVILATATAAKAGPLPRSSRKKRGIDMFRTDRHDEIKGIVATRLLNVPRTHQDGLDLTTSNLVAKELWDACAESVKQDMQARADAFNEADANRPPEEVLADTQTYLGNKLYDVIRPLIGHGPKQAGDCCFFIRFSYKQSDSVIKTKHLSISANQKQGFEFKVIDEGETAAFKAWSLARLSPNSASVQDTSMDVDDLTLDNDVEILEILNTAPIPNPALSEEETHDFSPLAVKNVASTVLVTPAPAPLPVVPVGNPAAPAPLAAGTEGGDGAPPVPPVIPVDNPAAPAPLAAGAEGGDGAPPVPPVIPVDNPAAPAPLAAGTEGGDGAPPVPPVIPVDNPAAPAPLAAGTEGGDGGDGAPPVPPVAPKQKGKAARGRPRKVAVVLKPKATAGLKRKEVEAGGEPETGRPTKKTKVNPSTAEGPTRRSSRRGEASGSQTMVEGRQIGKFFYEKGDSRVNWDEPYTVTWAVKPTPMFGPTFE